MFIYLSRYCIPVFRIHIEINKRWKTFIIYVRDRAKLPIEIIVYSYNPRCEYSFSIFVSIVDKFIIQHKKKKIFESII